VGRLLLVAARRRNQEIGFVWQQLTNRLPLILSVIAAWVCLLMSNGFGAAGPAYGFNVLNGSPHGQAIHFTAVSFMYGAIALSKTAFAVTMLRLASGWRSKGPLWLVMVLTNTFNLALFILTWLDICNTQYDLAHIPGRCIPMFVATWLHLGATLNSLVCDIILTCYPWWIISQVEYIPAREKWAVAASMGLVGVTILVEIAKIIIFSMIPYEQHGVVDYTCKFPRLWVLIFSWPICTERLTFFW
jgi:hypothetical protein